MNIQPPEKIITTDTKLQVHSIFKTIQGEGPFTGTPAIFIRLSGCNLQCPSCDTEYTSKRIELTRMEIASKVIECIADNHIRLVVITGGEPFRQPIGELIRLLVTFGYYVQIETNGTLPPPAYGFSLATEERFGAYIVCSPKTGSINKHLLPHICAFKYVLNSFDVNWKDGLPITALNHPAKPQLARPPKDALIYLQPMDTGNLEYNQINLQKCVELCIKFGYILQLQVHKLIGVE